MRLLPIVTATLCLLATPLGAQPRVVASFPAIQSIVAGVMDGVGVPDTVVKGGASPHVYALRPGDARLLEAADLVVWVGPAFEGQMARALRALGPKTRQILWADLPGTVLLAAREGGPWEGHAHAHGHAHDDTRNDGHLFLDPRNAIVLAVFHDALQYFETRYGLTPAGSITVSPERRPGAQRLQRIRERVRRAQAICVFAEPQFEPSLVATVVEGTQARVATIDYVGVGVTPGKDAYAAILTKLADDLAACLKAS